MEKVSSLIARAVQSATVSKGEGRSTESKPAVSNRDQPIAQRPVEKEASSFADLRGIASCSMETCAVNQGTLNLGTANQGAVNQGIANRGAGDSGAKDPRTMEFPRDKVRSAIPEINQSIKTNPKVTAPSSPPRTHDRSWRPRATSELMLVKSVLAKALARKGLEKKIERYAFILHWKEIVGESFAIICKPECLSRNTLIIRVLNSGWAQELSFMKPVLLQRLSTYLPPGDLVDDISFRVGPL